MFFVLKRKTIKGTMRYFLINSDDVLYCADTGINKNLLTKTGLKENEIVDMLNKGFKFGNVEYSKNKGHLDGIFSDISDYSVSIRNVKYQPAVIVIDNNTECIQYIGCCNTEGKVFKIDIEFFNTLVHRGLVIDFPKRLSYEAIRLQLMTSYPVIKRELGLGISVVSKIKDTITVAISYIDRDNNVVKDIQQVLASDINTLKKNIKVPDYSTDFNKVLESLQFYY